MYNQTQGGKCMEYSLTTSFRPFGVPPNARFEGRDTLGAEVSGLGLEVDQFIDELGKKCHQELIGVLQT